MLYRCLIVVKDLGKYAHSEDIITTCAAGGKKSHICDDDERGELLAAVVFCASVYILVYGQVLKE